VVADTVVKALNMQARAGIDSRDDPRRYQSTACVSATTDFIRCPLEESTPTILAEPHRVFLA
jgi:hypothetical protein